MTIRQFADTIGMESMCEVKDERSFHSISSESESRINMAVAIFMEYAKYLYENNTHLFATLKNEVFTEAMNFANNNTVYIDKGTFIKRLDSELDHFKTEMNASRKNSIKNRFVQYLGDSISKKRFECKDPTLQNEFLTSLENMQPTLASKKQNAFCNMYYDECMALVKQSCRNVALAIF